MGCCTNTHGVMSTKYTWKVSKTATWEDIHTYEQQFETGRVTFHNSYDYVIGLSKKKKGKRGDEERFKAMVCALQKMTKKLLREGNVKEKKNNNAATNQEKITAWKTKIDTLCKNLESGVKKAKTCKEELGATKYKKLKDSCDTDESVKRVGKKCKCVKKPPTVVKGCMDSAYEEYDENATEDDGSCKTLKKPDLVYGCMDAGEDLPANVKVTNYDPDAT